MARSMQPARGEHGGGRDDHAGARHQGTGRGEHGTGRDEPGVDLELVLGEVMVHDSNHPRPVATSHPEDGPGGPEAHEAGTPAPGSQAIAHSERPPGNIAESPCIESA